MKHRLAVSLLALVAAGLVGVSGSVLGAGFYLSEVGTPGSLGTGGVANPTNTVGADAAWTNPAGMTGIDRTQVLGGVQVVFPSKDRYRTLDLPFDETWKLSAAYRLEHGEDLALAVGATVFLVGDAALEQTAQGVTVGGDYDSNLLAIVGATLRYDL